MLTISGVAPSLAARVYGERVAPLSDYGAQFMEAPAKLGELDVRVAEGLWRLPVRALPPAVLQPLRALGWPLPRPLEDRCARAAAGAAQRHANLAAPWAEALNAARDEHSALIDLGREETSDGGFWRATAL